MDGLMGRTCVVLVRVHRQGLPGADAVRGIGLHLVEHGLAEGVEPPLLDEPEQARLLPVLAVPVVAEDLLVWVGVGRGFGVVG